MIGSSHHHQLALVACAYFYNIILHLLFNSSSNICCWTCVLCRVVVDHRTKFLSLARKTPPFSTTAVVWQFKSCLWCFFIVLLFFYRLVCLYLWCDSSHDFDNPHVFLSTVSREANKLTYTCCHESFLVRFSMLSLCRPRFPAVKIKKTKILRKQMYFRPCSL